MKVKDNDWPFSSAPVPNTTPDSEQALNKGARIVWLSCHTARALCPTPVNVDKAESDQNGKGPKNMVL